MFQDVSCAVAGSIVYNNHFNGGVRLTENGIQTAAQEFGGIVSGYKDGNH
jgi:hypothetical protein